LLQYVDNFAPEFCKSQQNVFLLNFDQIKKVFPKSYVSQLEFHYIYFSSSNKILKCVI